MVVNLFQKMSNMAPILSFYFLNNVFRSQTRPYLGFKTNPRDTKDTVCCKCKFIEQHGNHFKCTYEKRTDHNRKAINSKKKSHSYLHAENRQQEDIRNFVQEALQEENDEVTQITFFDPLCIFF